MVDDREWGRLDAAEAWWALVARILAFFGGMGVMFYETAVGEGKAWVIVGALTMMGFIAGTLLTRLLDGGGK